MVVVQILCIHLTCLCHIYFLTLSGTLDFTTFGEDYACRLMTGLCTLMSRNALSWTYSISVIDCC